MKRFALLLFIGLLLVMCTGCKVGNLWFGNHTITNVSDLNALRGVEIMMGILLIEESNLASLAGLERLTQVRTLRIENNTALESLDGLEGFTTAEGVIIIENNDALLNLEGLGNLNSVFQLDIIDNDSLASIDGLENITTLVAANIVNNSALTNLNGFSGLEEIGFLEVAEWMDDIFTEGLFIRENESLGSLSGLDNLGKLLGSYVIVGNPNLCTSDAEELGERFLDYEEHMNERLILYYIVDGNKNCP